MRIIKNISISLLLIGMVASCASLASTSLSETEQTKLLANYSADPEARRLKRNCISPDWRVVDGETFTEDAYQAKFSYVKRIGRQNAYLLEYNKSCTRLTRSGRVGLAIPLDCRGDMLRIRGIPCSIDAIYNVTDKQDARKLALLILRDRAAAKKMTQPDEILADLEDPTDESR